jgi:hypothetical protein
MTYRTIPVLQILPHIHLLVNEHFGHILLFRALFLHPLEHILNNFKNILRLVFSVFGRFKKAFYWFPNIKQNEQYRIRAFTIGSLHLTFI